MGVPAFFAWLAQKHPEILVDLEDARAEQAARDGSDPATNTSLCDNLYLDFNGIIHPCCHPEGKPAPKDEAEMFANVAALLDQLVATARPAKVLVIAIDGCAPRAKMNQQRARRFRSAQERVENEKVKEALREEMRSKGQRVPQKKPPSWDHNVITPGTPFMARLAAHLRVLVEERLSSAATTTTTTTTRANESDPWRGLAVVISDATVPGEGEHKIMDFVRRQRAQVSQSVSQSVQLFHFLFYFCTSISICIVSCSTYS